MKFFNVFYLIIILIIIGCTPGGEKYSGKNTPEKHRPLFHFTPDSMWMNDPNGLVFLDGEYHLFYQYYPDSTVWGPMHWGHAISTDLVHWQHQPIALYPDSLGYIFSGSAVFDKNNTSALGTANNPPLVAIFTYHNITGERSGKNNFQSQGIAYSLDKGRTWKKYEKNPVLPNPGIRDFRDPKVNWNEETGKWIMIMAVQDHVNIYSSPNLKNWTLESEFGQNLGAHGGVWECPDLFKIKIANSDESKWVMLVSINPGGPNGGSATQYFTGNFDGHIFTTAQTDTRWIDKGADDYAGVTWSNIPDSDGRRIFLGWMSNWNYAQIVPTVKWRSAMTFPRELTLTANGIIKSAPVKEIELLRNRYKKIKEVKVEGEFDLAKEIPYTFYPLEMNMDLKLTGMDDFEFILSNDNGERLVFGYDGKQKQLYIDRTNSSKNKFSAGFFSRHSTAVDLSGKVNLKMLLDVSSIELFVNEGEAVMTDIFFPNKLYNKFIFSSARPITIEKASFYKLNDLKE